MAWVFERVEWQSRRDKVIDTCVTASLLPENKNKWVCGWWCTSKYEDGRDASRPLLSIQSTWKEARERVRYQYAGTVARNGKVRK